MQRLDRGNLDRSHGPQFLVVTGLDDAVMGAGGGQLIAGLVDDLAPVGDHQYTPITIIWIIMVIIGNLEQYPLSAISALAERAVAALVPR